MSMKLYTTPDCFMCDVVKEMLQELGASFEVVDISGQADLLAQYESSLPVVDADGKILESPITFDQLQGIIG